MEELLPTLNTKRRLLRDRLRPRRIILVRHGESVGNRDKTAYQHTPLVCDSELSAEHLKWMFQRF